MHMILNEQLGNLMQSQALMLTTAESCTGGGVSTAITEVAGSSAWFDRAFITYSNEAKMDMLGVNPETLTRHGAVSEQTVEEMVKGALDNSKANIGISVSGIAGPGGGTEEKPIGTVFLAWADEKGWLKTCCYRFKGNRAQIRQQAVEAALQGLYTELLSRC
ncbi:CinA family protein [Vibrio ostreicida]|uniref:CinA family protein n=1 Tax=Vibrio ostreicida TaxID=526588 RepID=UPI000970FEC1|nr:CinA family protein [Vibrio ostreicida]